MYGYKAVLEDAGRGGTYGKGAMPETPRIQCRKKLVPKTGKALL